MAGGQSYEMASFAINSYVHIKDGAAIAIQGDIADSFTNFSSALTIADVQNNEIELHIHPQFVNMTNPNGADEPFKGECNANGRHLVDDGIVLNTTGMQNRYTFNFHSDCYPFGDATQKKPMEGIRMTFNTVASATLRNETMINKNDYVRKIVIYNTQDLLMNGDYTLNVAFTNNMK